MQFIPFTDIKKYERVVVVDSFHPRALALSHWKGAPKPPGLPPGDTSLDWVLNTQQYRPELLAGYRYVTNNHFDVDGFLGIWALLNPGLAAKHSQLLRKMAQLGDFRELSLETEEDHTALKLVCWLNKEEAEQFYAPFASYNPQNKLFKGKGEAAWCVPKYEYFLPRFAAMLQQPEVGKPFWQAEYERVLRDAELLRMQGQITTYENLHLQVVEAPEPLHYYALFGQSAGQDVVLSLYPNRRYELEYKYTGWVDTDRLSYPRLDFRPLAEELNRWETGPYRWQAEPPTDTAPILRLTDKPLSKEARYASPYRRPIFASSLEPEQFLAIVTQYFTKNLEGITPKKNWSWEEVRFLSKPN
jgi:hypothetical protein